MSDSEPYISTLKPFWVSWQLSPRVLTFGWESGEEYWEVKYGPELYEEASAIIAVPTVYVGGQKTTTQGVPSQIAQRMGHSRVYKSIIPWLASGNEAILATIKEKYEDD